MTVGIDMMEFVTNSSGFFRTNQFKVSIVPPSGMTVERHLNMACKKTSLPGFSIDGVNTNVGGSLEIDIASDIKYPDMDFQFYMTNTFREKDFFDEWSKLIIDDEQRLGYYDDYTTDIVVTAITQNDREVKQYTLIGAKPKVVGDVDVDFSSENEIGILNVSMSYASYVR